MNNDIKKILQLLEEEYKDNISANARNYIEVNLGEKAESLGFDTLREKLRSSNAVIPLMHPVKGMKVRIDGRTFINYGQFDSGIAVPGYLAKESGLPYKTFVPNDSMILNLS